MKTLLPIFYLPPISWFSEFLDENQEVVLEQFENFPKQTYRNRAHIYGANGRLALIIPIHHNGKRIIKDIEISNRENWRSQHWKSIKYAYQSSPYFEFYEDKLEKIFLFETQSLLEFNLHALTIIVEILKEEKIYSFTEEYIKVPEGKNLREQFSSKQFSEYYLQEYYYQVFSDKIGFIADLSILDLICNLGPESSNFIKKNIKYPNNKL